MEETKNKFGKPHVLKGELNDGLINIFEECTPFCIDKAEEISEKYKTELENNPYFKAATEAMERFQKAIEDSQPRIHVLNEDELYEENIDKAINFLHPKHDPKSITQFALEKIIEDRNTES